MAKVTIDCRVTSWNGPDDALSVPLIKEFYCTEEAHKDLMAAFERDGYDAFKFLFLEPLVSTEFRRVS